MRTHQRRYPRPNFKNGFLIKNYPVVRYNGKTMTWRDYDRLQGVTR